MWSLKWPRCSSASGGPTRKKPSGSRVTKPSNSAWSMRSRFSRHFHQRVLRRGAQLHGDVVADPVQIDQHRGLLALRQHGREIDRHRGRPDAALGPDEGVDLAELALAAAARRGARSRRPMASRNSVRFSGCIRKSFAPARMHAITVSPSAW